MELKLIETAQPHVSYYRRQAKLTLQQVIDEIDYCRTLDELKQKLSEALK